MGHGIVEIGIEIGGKRRAVRCELATPRELKTLARWKAPGGGTDAMSDAVEYARLTCKRWHFYLDEGRAVIHPRQLRPAAVADAEELAFLIVARVVAGRSGIIGLCLCRRTWCNHLVVDFLAVHPDCLTPGPRRAKGLGPGLIFAVSEIAERLGSGALWGEATRGSAPIYRRMFSRPSITDLFYTTREQYRRFSRSFANRHQTRSLLPTSPPLTFVP